MGWQKVLTYDNDSENTDGQAADVPCRGLATCGDEEILRQH